MSIQPSSSSGISALVPASKQSIKDEVREVAAVTVTERSKDSITVCIVREQGLSKLEKACEYNARFYERELPLVVLTTAQLLQDTIDSLRLSSKRSILTLLFSPMIDEVSFHVPSHFKQLKLLRCVQHSDGKKLLIHGSSTYNDVRLDQWQAHRHGRHELLVGYKHGVRIKLTHIASLPNWSRCRSEFGDSEKAQLRRHFETLSTESQWDRIRGPVSAIVGIILGTVKLGTGLGGAAGVDVEYAFGFHALEMGAAGAKLTAVATAAGPAVVLGVLSAAAVYFVPWESLLEWLQGALWCIWDKACAIWENFKDWVLCLFAGSSPKKPRRVQGGTPRTGDYGHGYTRSANMSWRE